MEALTNIAIIGTGIAGLGCGYLLHRRFDVSLFDGNDYAGGHSNTIAVDREGELVPVDTGFMVFNEVTYPKLTRLFARLGVETVPTSMSFGVQHRGAGIEYCGSSVDQLFAQRRNLVRPRFLRMLQQVSRFNRDAREAIRDSRNAGVTLEQYIQARGYGTSFRDLYLLPMAAAVWSSPFEDVRHFPATTLLRFFDNHGLLGGLEGHHPWLTVRGGAKRYVEAMTRDFRERIALGNAVRRVERDGGGVTLSFANGERRRFDEVIFACHADQALALLAAPTPDERRLLSPFRYQRNVALLHSDPAPMPRSRKAWASWNVRIEEGGDGISRATTIYWMNSLQHLSARQDYFVSIDDPGLVDPARVLRTIVYHHPLFNLETVRAQQELASLNRMGEQRHTYFCGSYFGYGFHEDGFASAIEASRAVASAEVWKEEAA
jgi:predicted NAD/FAD-binding protein